MDGCAVAAASVAVAVAQRIGVHPLVPVAALALAAAAPWLASFGGWKVPWVVFTTVVVAATTSLMAIFPVNYDFAVFVLVMLVGHLGATERIAWSAAATALAVLPVVLLDLSGEFEGSEFSVAAILVAWDVGFIMHYQQRRLEEELEGRAEREAQAALQERQRIAREIHDVVAHSLSVTMLHLTAARRDLEDDGDNADIEAAIEALRDAELLGRQSMGDIRKT